MKRGSLSASGTQSGRAVQPDRAQDALTGRELGATGDGCEVGEIQLRRLPHSTATEHAGVSIVHPERTQVPPQGLDRWRRVCFGPASSSVEASARTRVTACSAAARCSLRFCSVTSCVKQRVWMNVPSSHRTFELICTCLIEPSLHRSRAS